MNYTTLQGRVQEPKAPQEERAGPQAGSREKAKAFSLEELRRLRRVLHQVNSSFGGDIEGAPKGIRIPVARLNSGVPGDLPAE